MRLRFELHGPGLADVDDVKVFVVRPNPATAERERP
jgi:hypothetical protein